MAIIDYIDGPNRDIYLADGVRVLDDILAFYREYRTIRRLNEETRKYDNFMILLGGQSKGGGKYIGRTMDLQNAKIIPADDADYDLDVTIEIIDSFNGLSGRDVFDKSTLTHNVNIDINIAPVEVITLELGVSGLTEAESDQLGMIIDVDNKTDLIQAKTDLIPDAPADQTLIELENADIKSLIESQRGAHTWSGNIFYVDPVNGATYASGARGRKNNPILSLQDCHDNLVTDSNHDVIILLSGATSGTTIIDERVTLNKRYLFVRGPGRDFCFKPTTEGDAIRIRADGIELSGFQVGTHTEGNGNGIDVLNCDFTKISKLWVNYTMQDGIRLKNTNHSLIVDNTMHEAGQGTDSNAIQITSDTNSDHNVIKDNYISDIDGHGINVGGGALTTHTTIFGNKIEDCSNDGVNIQTDVLDTFVIENSFGNITGENIDDNGTNSIIQNNEQWATENIQSTINANVSAIPTASENADTLLNSNLPTYTHDDTTTANVLHDIGFIDKWIYVDEELSTNGDGKTSTPFNDVDDAITYAKSVGWRKIMIMSDCTLNSNIVGFTIKGVGFPIINLNGKTTTRADFLGVKLTGSYVGAINVRESILEDNMEINGYFENCGINGDLTSQVGSNALLKDCASLIQTVTINQNSGGASVVNLTDFAGNITLINCSTVGDVSYIGMREGLVTLASSCTAGFIAIGGNATVTNGSNGSTVNLTGLTQNIVADAVWDEEISGHLNAGSTGNKLNTASSGGVDYGALADAVWGTNIINYVGVGSAGESLFKILSELGNNAQIIDNGDNTKTVTIWTEAGSPNIHKRYTISEVGNIETKVAI